jgi:hypothetical protein
LSSLHDRVPAEEVSGLGRGERDVGSEGSDVFFPLYRDIVEEMSVDEGGSYSSRMSNKSEKNMADFDGEDSGCEEEELAQLAAAQQVQVSCCVNTHRPGYVVVVCVTDVKHVVVDSSVT